MYLLIGPLIVLAAGLWLTFGNYEGHKTLLGVCIAIAIIGFMFL